jgi:hypothetical protein
VVEFEVALALVGFLRGVGVVMEVGFVVTLVGYIKGLGPVVRVGMCSSRCAFLFRRLGVWVEQMVRRGNVDSLRSFVPLFQSGQEEVHQL